MKQRIITGAVLIVLAVLWMFYFPWYAYLAASVLIAVLGGWEWGQFISAKARVAYGAAILVLGGAAVAKSGNELIAPMSLKKAGIVYLEQGDKRAAKKAFEQVKADYPASTEAQDIDKYIAIAQ